LVFNVFLSFLDFGLRLGILRGQYVEGVSRSDAGGTQCGF
jgi:hypothetical protein